VPARISLAGGPPVQAQTIDISQSGAQLTGVPAAREGMEGILYLERLELPISVVKARDSGQIGVSFHLSDHQSDLLENMLTSLQARIAA
jgi:hypothetical protein